MKQGYHDSSWPNLTGSLHVKGWTDDEDSTLFKTTEGIEPLTFVLGEGEVIEGWEKGLMGMWCGITSASSQLSARDITDADACFQWCTRHCMGWIACQKQEKCSQNAVLKPALWAAVLARGGS